MHFADALTARTKQTSPVCVGLDPRLPKLPAKISKGPAGVLTFNKGIIDAVKDIASSVKINLAFFEVLGWEGMKVFWETCAHAKAQGLIVIADGKRGDIGSTCEAYADAYLFPESPVDALTVNPYLGSDGIAPFIERCTKHEKGIFVLVKTSNQSSEELQDLPTGNEAVHEHLAQLVESWATVGARHGVPLQGSQTNLSCVGAVVGATYPEELTYLRTLMPHCPFLIPGYGTQGGTAKDVKRGFLPDGTGAIVNASRSITEASSGEDWQEATRRATEEMASALRS